MSRIMGLVLLMVWCMLSSSAEAEQISCANAKAMQNVSITQLAGTWFEVARNPNVTNMGCIEIDLGLNTDNKTLGITVTYVDPQQTSWENLTMATNITLNFTNTDGYNVSFSADANNHSTNTLKLLDTDYKNYAFVCGYANASNESTSFGIVLTRLRMPSSSDLSLFEQLASKNYSNFNNLTVLTQSQKCYKSGATTPLPMIATVFAAIYILLKHIN